MTQVRTRALIDGLRRAAAGSGLMPVPGVWAQKKKKKRCDAMMRCDNGQHQSVRTLVGQLTSAWATSGKVN